MLLACGVSAGLRRDRRACRPCCVPPARVGANPGPRGSPMPEPVSDTHLDVYKRQPFTWAFFAHILVLVVFVLDLQFLAGRYVAVLSLLATPLVGYGLWLLMRRFPRWKHAMILLAGISLASNVVSLNPSKQHFVQAGSWLAQNASESPRVYICLLYTSVPKRSLHWRRHVTRKRSRSGYRLHQPL